MLVIAFIFARLTAGAPEAMAAQNTSIFRYGWGFGDANHLFHFGPRGQDTPPIYF